MRTRHRRLPRSMLCAAAAGLLLLTACGRPGGAELRAAAGRPETGAAQEQSESTPPQASTQFLLPAATEEPIDPAAELRSEKTAVAHTAAGELLVSSRLLSDASGGGEGGALSQVYSASERLCLQLRRGDGSLYQEFSEQVTAGVRQELLTADLDGDGSEELLLRLHTYEGERCVLLFAYDPVRTAYSRLDLAEDGGLCWGSDYDAASGQLWHRYGSGTVVYDCFALRDGRLETARRLTDTWAKGPQQRFSEYAAEDGALRPVQENVSAGAIDHEKWNFVNFD